jgi:hypothetical protein
MGRGAGIVCEGALGGADGRAARAQVAHTMSPRASGTGRTIWVPHELHKTAIRALYQTRRRRRSIRSVQR